MPDAHDRESLDEPHAPVALVRLVRGVVARGGSAALDVQGRELKPVRDVIDGAQLQPGEAVTLLTPIAEALALVHRLGWCHGSIGLDAIALDARRAPVLVDWGRARPQTQEPGSIASGRRERRGSAHSDVESLRVLIREVLLAAGCTETETQRVTAATGPDQDGGAQALADEVFALAEPLPILAASGAHPVVARPRTPQSASSGRRDTAVDAKRQSQVPLDDDARRAPIVSARGLRRLQRHVGALTRAVRRRPLLGVFGLCCMLGVGAVLLYGSTSPSQTPPETDGDAADSSVASTQSQGSSEDHLGGEVPDQESSNDELLAADDEEASARRDLETPLEAALELLTLRHDCIMADDATCLIALYAADAPGLDIELATLEHPDGGIVIPTEDCTLADRNGQIALIACESDAGRHLVTIEWGADGWRLREVRESASP